MAEGLRAVVDAADGPSVSRHLAARGTLHQFLEFVVHRSAYHLKEADPFSWALPRLAGRTKAALVEIQADEYGGGGGADALEPLPPDHGGPRPRRALRRLPPPPGPTLATVNLMSLFGLHRRWRGAIVGHLAVTEMTSTEPNRRYGNALRRLGFGPPATEFYDEHVEADAVHEQIAAHDLAGSLALEGPEMAGDVLFGARALLVLDRLVGAHQLARGGRGAARSGGRSPRPCRPERHGRGRALPAGALRGAGAARVRPAGRPEPGQRVRAVAEGPQPRAPAAAQGDRLAPGVDRVPFLVHSSKSPRTSRGPSR